MMTQIDGLTCLLTISLFSNYSALKQPFSNKIYFLKLTLKIKQPASSSRVADDIIFAFDNFLRNHGWMLTSDFAKFLQFQEIVSCLIRDGQLSRFCVAGLSSFSGQFSFVSDDVISFDGRKWS